METKKILFVTRFNELRFDALTSLLDLRKASYNHVVFLTVIESGKVAMRSGAGYDKTEEIKLREKANIRFIDWAENLFEQGMEVGVHILVGSFVGKLIEVAEKEKPDLIVIGRSKKSKLEQFYSGSDITEIVQRTSVPIFIYKYRAQKGNKPVHPFAKPLLAEDWSPATKKAVELLKELHEIIERVHLVHVADDKELKSPSAMGIQKTRKDTMKQLEDTCDILEEKGIDAKPHVYIGDTADEIEKAAAECEATMIIVGTSSKSSWRERLIGSTPKKLAEKSTFSTLLISAPGE